jgi:hypothetical protein
VIPPDVPLSGLEWSAAWLLTNWSWSALLDSLVGVAAIVLAWRQLALMNVQSAVMADQTKLATKQTEISERQLVLTMRQDEILLRTARLSIEVSEVAGEPSDGVSRFSIAVRNDGTRGARGIYVHLTLKDASARDFAFLTSKGTPPTVSRQRNASNGSIALVSAYFEGPFLMPRSTHIGRIEFVRSQFPRWIELMWQISSEDGVFPSPGTPGCYQSDSGLVGVLRI